MTQHTEDADRPGGPQPIDHRVAPTRTGIVVPDVRGQHYGHSLDMRVAEFQGLAEAIGVDIVHAQATKIREVRPATYLGAGHVEDLKAIVADKKIELLLVDAALAPVQQRNLETELKTKVLDRTGLILEIFGERAATREGVLQVELAHLNYQRSRLVRSWTHLERQRGGFGFLGGPGETQIESDRRLLEERIRLLEDQLDKVKRSRAQQRAGREAAQFPVVALVGYTNAGKSTLFNRLTGAGVFAKDLLFATLDTTVRKIALPHGREIMMSDTVGFVADLPTTLVAAFRATLEEVTEADIILHVRDVANPDSAPQADDVLTVLAELGVSGTETPIIEVWNKIDVLETPEQGRGEALARIVPAGTVAASVPVSAVTGEGIDTLLATIETTLAGKSRSYRIKVSHTDGAGLAWLYAHAEIITRDEPDDEGQVYEVRVDPRHKDGLMKRFGAAIERV